MEQPMSAMQSIKHNTILQQLKIILVSFEGKSSILGF